MRSDNFYFNILGLTVWEPRSSQENPTSLATINQAVKSCTQCPLSLTRTNTVFYRGSEQAKLMVIGEAPGFYEDQQGLPFVGKAGMLLNKMLKCIDLSPEEVYITNVIKCRPPENRDPTVDEIAKCSKYLQQQIRILKPKLILGLGKFAAQFLLEKPMKISACRGKFYKYLHTPFIISYHPAYLLRNPAAKKDAYTDLQLLKSKFLEL